MKGLFAALVALIILGGVYYWYASEQTPVMNTVNNDSGMPMTDDTGNDGDEMMMPTTTSPSGSTSGGAAANVGASVDTGAVGANATASLKTFTVTSTGMAFNTKSLTVKKGDRVRITFTNGGGTHDFRVDGYNVGTKVIQGGASETFEFVADKAGSFEYYCSVGSHRQMGMKGTLVVQ